MTEYENKLIDTIRNHPNPGEAFVTALEIILLYINNASLKSASSSKNHH